MNWNCSTSVCDCQCDLTIKGDNSSVNALQLSKGKKPTKQKCGIGRSLFLAVLLLISILLVHREFHTVSQYSNNNYSDPNTAKTTTTANEDTSTIAISTTPPQRKVKTATEASTINSIPVTPPPPLPLPAQDPLQTTVSSTTSTVGTTSTTTTTTTTPAPSAQPTVLTTPPPTKPPDIQEALQNAPNSLANMKPYPFRSQAIPCTEAQRSKTIAEFIQNDEFKAQGDVDIQLHFYLHTICAGIYIELGAMEGITFSNTYFLNQHFDWKGVLIEASPTMAAHIPKHRTNEIAIITAGVCHEPQTLHFINNNGSTSGFWEFASHAFRQTWWGSTNLEDFKQHQVIPVQCTPMAELLKQHAHHIRHYDLLSLDVEGAELEVLQSIDFITVGFGVIVVEADSRNIPKDQAVRELLHAQGYRMVPKQYDRPQPERERIVPINGHQSYWPLPHANNDFFFHQQFDTIYKRFGVSLADFGVSLEEAEEVQPDQVVVRD
ncbi:expressed unknown protein [Seminavis robusta]|uniref:Methyltransferase FkbM domain-containing protein n=1 Tax=Seminavis robusta TaxID=568900 RepID=A0A9N8EJQ1_9STRA|nr:expressed unknown protein [Seminavis robusta]|eukprot:Sro1096_g240810.1 n/a (491) ;mRNA; r:26315-27787